MKLAVIHGFAEGPYISRSFRRAVAAGGFSFTTNPHQADLLLAHSGGCFLVPQGIKSAYLILINPPYWPGRHPLRGVGHKVIHERKDMFWLQKTILNCLYAVAHPAQWVRMEQAIRRQQWPQPEPQQTVIVIRSADDSFSQSEQLREYISARGWVYQELPGDHDELWRNPQPYVELLQTLSGIPTYQK